MTTAGPRDNFLTEIIDADLAAGRHDHVITRFPPEPNGYLHIGHSKSILLNSGLARRYDGTFHLRFDDTNPVAEDIEYVQSIQADIAWLLGATVDNPPWDKLFFASDFFEQMYRHAELLIESGKAYIDTQTSEQIREQRGDFNTPGVNSPFRDRPTAESLDIFRRMRAGEFEEGIHVLRAKIDMAHPNMIMRDPVLYRVRHAHHHRTGDAWCIYPMYDFAHCLEDAFEGVTHSICTLEFESNRALYDWNIDEVDDPAYRSRPHQYEFARLALGYTVMSKRKLLQLVNEGVVDGWDDPRMPTLAGMRRRGITPHAIAALAEMVGVAKNNSVVDIGKFEYCIRTDLEQRTPRAMAVLDPLKVTITNWPEGHTEHVDAPWWPQDDTRSESRRLPLSANVFIERDDFAEEPPSGFKRLSPGREVRLRHGCVIRCDEVIKDADGAVTELRCTYDPATIGGKSPADRKVKGTVHWVSADHGWRADVRLYDRLFTTETPDGDPERDFKTFLNPQSLSIIAGAALEPALADAAPGSRWQFERVGYFVADAGRSEPGKPAFQRTISLRDTWAKKTGDRGVTGRPDRDKGPTEKTHRERNYAEERAAGDATLYARFQAHTGAGIGEEIAFALTASEAIDGVYSAAAAVAGDAAAPWVAVHLAGALSRAGKDLSDVNGAYIGQIAKYVDTRAIAANAGKSVLDEVVATGRDPAVIIDEQDLLAVRDDDAVGAALDAAFEAHPDESARLLAGEKKLLGFFMGRVMKAMRGKGDPQAVRKALQARLG